MVGPKAPNRKLLIQNLNPRSFAITTHNKIPQSPPKNKSDKTLGTPKGIVGFKL